MPYIDAVIPKNETVIPVTQAIPKLSCEQAQLIGVCITALTRNARPATSASFTGHRNGCHFFDLYGGFLNSLK